MQKVKTKDGVALECSGPLTYRLYRGHGSGMEVVGRVHHFGGDGWELGTYRGEGYIKDLYFYRKNALIAQRDEYKEYIKKLDKEIKAEARKVKET